MSILIPIQAVSRNLISSRTATLGVHRIKFANPNNLISLVQQTAYQQRRHLDLQEYQSKKLLHEHGVTVQKFRVVENYEDIEEVLDPDPDKPIPDKGRWSGTNDDISNSQEFVIKAQVLAGGRGKGMFRNSGIGGVHVTSSKSDAASRASLMLKDRLITKQTTEKGVLVNKVMIAEAVRLTREFYFAIILDRSYENGLLFVASPYGGMDIEEASARDDRAIRRFTLPLGTELDFDTAQRISMAAFDLSIQDLDIIEKCSHEIMKLYKLFPKLDATQLEINPLGITSRREVVCVDAKIKFDENARFRNPFMDELEQMNADEIDERDFEAKKHNLNFIGLDGSIGCLVNGAGLAMATMDIIKLHGGEPANFLDVGGGANANQVTEAFRILSSDTRVRAIFVNIFGGIMRCDTIAEGIIAAAKKLELSVPIICRLQGTRVDEARKLLQQSSLGIITCDDLDEAAALVVNRSKAAA